MTDSAPPPDDDVHPPQGVRRTLAASAGAQTQFLNVISRDEAERRFREHLTLTPLGCETIPLSIAAGRVLATDLTATVDVPSFDRSNVDGFAVSSADTFAATEDAPRRLLLNDEVLSPGVRPREEVATGAATTIATGGMVPRGADAVLMVEHTDVLGEDRVEVRRAVAPGENVTFAGTDISRGETVLRAGQLLTSRELGVIAAVGRDDVSVWIPPRVAILSTGDEVVPPGEPLPTGSVYDSNAIILAAAVEECGGVPVRGGVIPDDEDQLETALRTAMEHDVVLLSGGTSKGAGDLSYRIVERLGPPGIVAHGVALKPGKPICLAVCDGKPVVILPGFPTSAIFTFHEFVAPVIRMLAGRPHDARHTVSATLPMRINSQRGRTEYLLVSLFERDTGDAIRDTRYAIRDTGDVVRDTCDEPQDTSEKADSRSRTPPPASRPPHPASRTPHPASRIPNHEPRIPNVVAYPMGQGSGSVTTFSRADGFITIDQQTEMVEAGTTVEVTLIDPHVKPADLTVITSHCVGLDRLLSYVQRQGFTLKVMLVGSTGALAAVKRGECDLAGIHLLDPETGEYNRPFLNDDVELVPGYGRMQCFVYRPDDDRFAGRSLNEALRAALVDAHCRMVNRNAGSGTRILIDRLLAANVQSDSAHSTCRVADGVTAVPLPQGGRGTDSEAPATNQGEGANDVLTPQAAAKPPGYGIQVRSHNAVCAAIAHSRADWGIAIDNVAALYGLGTTPITEEQFDLVVPRSRLHRPAVQACIDALNDAGIRKELQSMGFRLP